MSPTTGGRWLVTGASGLFGRSLCRHLVASGRSVGGVRRTHAVGIPGVEEVVLDVTDLAACASQVQRWRPDVVVHAAGLTNVDACEADERGAQLVHVAASAAVATGAVAAGARLVHISTDHLWDGSVPMVGESIVPTPVNAYGRTKWAGERAVLEVDGAALVVRTNFFGEGTPWRQSFSDWILQTLRAGGTLHAFQDVHFTPIGLPLLCPLIEELACSSNSGVLHVTGCERLSKLDFARRLAAMHDITDPAIVATSVADALLAAPRPRDMSLSTSLVSSLLGTSMPTVEASLAALSSAATGAHPDPDRSARPIESLEQR